MKDRGVYETPGGAIIYYAHNELENICLDRATFNYKETIGIRYAELVYDGMWFSRCGKLCRLSWTKPKRPLPVL